MFAVERGLGEGGGAVFKMCVSFISIFSPQKDQLLEEANAQTNQPTIKHLAAAECW